MEPIKVESARLSKGMIYWITGEPNSQILIRIDGKTKIRKLSRKNGRCICKTDFDAVVEISYLDVDFQKI